MNLGFSFGECGLLKISYCDIRNTVRLALAHQWLLGIIKKYMWGGFFKLLGSVDGVRWFRRGDEQKRFAHRVVIPDVAANFAFVVYVDVHHVLHFDMLMLI